MAWLKTVVLSICIFVITSSNLLNGQYCEDVLEVCKGSPVPSGYVTVAEGNLSGCGFNNSGRNSWVLKRHDACLFGHTMKVCKLGNNIPAGWSVIGQGNLSSCPFAGTGTSPYSAWVIKKTQPNQENGPQENGIELVLELDGNAPEFGHRSGGRPSGNAWIDRYQDPMEDLQAVCASTTAGYVFLDKGRYSLEWDVHLTFNNAACRQPSSEPALISRLNSGTWDGSAEIETNPRGYFILSHSHVCANRNGLRYELGIKNSFEVTKAGKVGFRLDALRERASAITNMKECIVYKMRLKKLGNLNLQNTGAYGTVGLANLSLTDDVAAQFGGALVGFVPGSVAVQNFVGTGTANNAIPSLPPINSYTAFECVPFQLHAECWPCCTRCRCNKGRRRLRLGRLCR